MWQFASAPLRALLAALLASTPGARPAAADVLCDAWMTPEMQEQQPQVAVGSAEGEQRTDDE